MMEQAVTSSHHEMYEPAAHLADVWAPGRDIWATAPEELIDASTRTQGDLYYMSISGTSMATPTSEELQDLF